MAKNNRKKFLKKFQQSQVSVEQKKQILLEKYDNALKNKNALSLFDLNQKEKKLFYTNENVSDVELISVTNNIKFAYLSCNYHELWFETMFKFRLLRFFTMQDLQEFTKIENVKKFENDFRNLELFDQSKKLKTLTDLFIGQSLDVSNNFDVKVIKKCLKQNLESVSEQITENISFKDICLQAIQLLNLSFELNFSPILVQMLICKNLVSCNVTPIVAYKFSEKFVKLGLSNQLFKVTNKDAEIFDMTNQINKMIDILFELSVEYINIEPINTQQANQFNEVLESIKPKNDLRLKITALMYIYYAKHFTLEEIEAYLNTQLRFVKPHIDALIELGMIEEIDNTYIFKQQYIVEIAKTSLL